MFSPMPLDTISDAICQIPKRGNAPKLSPLSDPLLTRYFTRVVHTHACVSCVHTHELCALITHISNAFVHIRYDFLANATLFLLFDFHVTVFLCFSVRQTGCPFTLPKFRPPVRSSVHKTLLPYKKGEYDYKVTKQQQHKGN